MLKECLAFIALTVSVHGAFLKCSEPKTFVCEEGTYALKTKIASNSKGEAVLLFLQEDPDDEESLCVSFKSTNQSWSEPERLGEASWMKDYQCAIDEKGLASFAWIGKQDYMYTVYYGQKISDEVRSAPYCLDVKDTNIRLLENGTLVCYGTNSNLGEFIETAKPISDLRLNLTSHDKTDPYSDLNFYPLEMDLSINTEGEVLAIQRQSSWKSNSIQAYWYNNGQLTSSELIHENSESGPWRMSLKGYQGHHLAVVKWSDNSGINIMTINGEKRSSIHFQSRWGGKVSLSPNDDVFVVYKSPDKTSLNAYYLQAGQTWMQTCLPLPKRDRIEISNVKSDQQGNCVVIWEERIRYMKNFLKDARTVIYGAVFSLKTQTWSDPILLSSPHFSCDKSSLALSREGRGWVSWVVSNGSDSGVQMAEITYGEDPTLNTN